MSADRIMVWVLLSRYSDGQGSEALRAYTDEKRAREDFELINTPDSFKLHELVQVPIYDGLEKGDDRD